MIKPSNRYLRYILVALLLTLIPVGLHSYLKLRGNDCVSIQDLSGQCTGRTDEETAGRRLTAIFGEVQWRAGILSEQRNVPALDCWIIRSYDPKKLYHLPEIGLVRGAAPIRRTTQHLKWEKGTVPVHRAFYPDSDGDVYAAYVLIYNSEPVDNPYLAQLLSFPRQLLTGVAPMNLFFISGRGPHGSLADMEERGNRWLLETMSLYRSLCHDRPESIR